MRIKGCRSLGIETPKDGGRHGGYESRRLGRLASGFGGGAPHCGLRDIRRQGPKGGIERRAQYERERKCAFEKGDHAYMDRETFR